MNSSTPPTVFVVDDDEAVCRALGRLIRAAGYEVACFESAQAFLSAYTCPPSTACLVLDVGLPDINGLDLQREMNATEKTMPIIFLTGQGDIAMTVRAMKAGAADFLAKPVNETDLLNAIDLALKRASGELSDRAELDAIRTRMSMLTPRERQVLTLLVKGRMNKQVACELGIAEKTIKVHRARVMEKMATRSLVDLVRVTDKVHTLSVSTSSS
jgi:FixJ family two-component response regulator